MVAGFSQIHSHMIIGSSVSQKYVTKFTEWPWSFDDKYGKYHRAIAM